MSDGNIDISQYAKEAVKFEKEMAKTKKRLSVDFDWYPWPIMNNMNIIDMLLTDNNRNFFSNFEKGASFIDIGAADGDLSFFWERKGFKGTIIDHPQTNYNGLKAAETLKKEFNSNVDILVQDIDTQFKLEKQYDFVFALGLLYHLKNPMYFLHELTLHSEYMFLSTKVAKYLPDGKTDISNSSVAYFLGPRECNNDPTNYWIFSVRGLEKVLNRSGWQILDFKTFGAVDNSTPHEINRDERAFVFAKRYDNVHDLTVHHDY